MCFPGYLARVNIGIWMQGGECNPPTKDLIFFNGESMSAVKIKVLGLYNFGDLTCSDNFDYKGLWEVWEAKGLNTRHEKYHMVRVVAFSEDQKVGVKVWMARVLLDCYASKVDRDLFRNVIKGEKLK